MNCQLSIRPVSLYFLFIYKTILTGFSHVCNHLSSTLHPFPPSSLPSYPDQILKILKILVNLPLFHPSPLPSFFVTC